MFLAMTGNTALWHVPARTISQLDGAQPQFSRLVPAFLQRDFPGHWPTCSPDLTPLDFFVCGFVRSIISREDVQNM
jgi:hypothetical protein